MRALVPDPALVLLDGDFLPWELPGMRIKDSMRSDRAGRSRPAADVGSGRGGGTRDG